MPARFRIVWAVQEQGTASRTSLRVVFAGRRGRLLAAGSYSLATGLQLGAGTGITVGFLLVAAVGLAAVALTARR